MICARARMRRARFAEPARFDDSVGNARAGSLGNYLDPGRSIGGVYYLGGRDLPVERFARLGILREITASSGPI
jgi:hypothetical protein